VGENATVISAVNSLKFLPFYEPEKTARLIIPRRGFPRVECAQGNPWPGGKGNTWAPTAIKQTCTRNGGNALDDAVCGMVTKHLLMSAMGCQIVRQ